MGLKREGAVFYIFFPVFVFFTNGRNTKKKGRWIYPGGTFQLWVVNFFQRGERWGEGGFSAQGKVWWYLVDQNHW